MNEPHQQIERTDAVWSVFRTDDTGNSFLVREHLTQVEAGQVVAEFTARGHKQYYWVEREDKK